MTSRDPSQSSKHSSGKSNGAPDLDESFGTRGRPLQARVLLRELFDLYQSRGKFEDHHRFGKRLQLLEPSGIWEFSRGVDTLIGSAERKLEQYTPPAKFIFGAFNSVALLELTPLREAVEGWYARLVPLARKEGTRQYLAEVLMAAAGATERYADRAAAEKIYDEAIRAADEGKAAHFFWMSKAYHFKMEGILNEAAENKFFAIPHDELAIWAKRALGVIDHPRNKHPLVQANLHVIAMMSVTATAFGVLEQAQLSPAGFAQSLAARVAQTAAFAEDKQLLPMALIELAQHCRANGDWGEAIAMRIFALEMLLKNPDPAAQRLAVSAWRVIMAEIDSREPPDESGSWQAADAK